MRYVFDHYEVNGARINSNPLDLEVTRDINVKAIYVADKCAVTIKSSPKGVYLRYTKDDVTHTKKTPFVLDFSETMTVKAPRFIRRYGRKYHFYKWSDGSKLATRTLMPGTYSVTAYYHR